MILISSHFEWWSQSILVSSAWHLSSCCGLFYSRGFDETRQGCFRLFSPTCPFAFNASLVSLSTAFGAIKRRTYLALSCRLLGVVNKSNRRYSCSCTCFVTSQSLQHGTSIADYKSRHCDRRQATYNHFRLSVGYPCWTNHRYKYYSSRRYLLVVNDVKTNEGSIWYTDVHWISLYALTS